jgi:hypothetical protein
MNYAPNGDMLVEAQDYSFLFFAGYQTTSFEGYGGYIRYRLPCLWAQGET